MGSGVPGDAQYLTLGGDTRDAETLAGRRRAGSIELESPPGGHVVTLMSLAVPILLSAVIVFAVSSVIHMLSPWHKDDYRKLAGEEAFRSAVKPLAIPPGDYMVPRPASRTEMATPAFRAKLDEGPKMLLTVMPNGFPSMMPQLVGWFLYCVVVGAVGAHVAGTQLAPGATYGAVFHVIAMVTFAGYALALWQMSIWYMRSWKTTIKMTMDGAAYALLSAGVFGWLWPT
jgi:hypothetical protein